MQFVIDRAFDLRFQNRGSREGHFNGKFVFDTHQDPFLTGTLTFFNLNMH